MYLVNVYTCVDEAFASVSTESTYVRRAFVRVLIEKYTCVLRLCMCISKAFPGVFIVIVHLSPIWIEHIKVCLSSIHIENCTEHVYLVAIELKNCDLL